MDKNNTSDDSKIVQEVKYAVGDICMISQSSRCLQFHPACITQIVDNNLSILYLTTTLCDAIPMGHQVRSLYQVRRGNKRS